MKEEKNIGQLPPNWTWVTLGEVCEKISNGANTKQFDEKIGFPISRIETIWNENIDLNRVKYINENDPEFIDKYSLKKDDILFSHINSDIHLGKTAIFKNQVSTLIHGTNLLLIRLKKDVSSDFFNYQFKYKRKKGEFIAIAQKSVNQSSINQQKLKSIKFILPPFEVQKDIISKIEELFSELDKGIEQLKTIRKQLKNYRQAVLKWAFEGRLTNEVVKDKELPKGWKIEILKSVCNIIGGVTKGRDFKGKETIYLPYLRVANVQDGYLDLKEIKKIEVLTTDKEKYKLLIGDILYTEGGDKDKLGRGTIWRGEIKDCIHQNHIFRARPISDNFNSQYISYYSQTKSAKNYFFKHGKQTTNLASINLTILSNLPIPICSINEQIKIVQEIESRLSVADKMEETINQSLQQAEALRQSILKKAFEGKLVATDTIEAVKETAKVIPLERKVLAGKIIHLLHDDKYFGLTKFQKILYLVENFSGVTYETNFIQERAGPYDKEFTIAFRKEMQEKDWLQEVQKGSITKFIPGENIGSLIKNYAGYFREKGKEIVFVIQQLKDKTTHEAELIATLYGVWNNRLIKKKPIKIDLLVVDFFNWSPKKIEEFQAEEVVATYKWMKEIKFVPRGFGKVIGTY